MLTAAPPGSLDKECQDKHHIGSVHMYMSASSPYIGSLQAFFGRVGAEKAFAQFWHMKKGHKKYQPFKICFIVNKPIKF